MRRASAAIAWVVLCVARLATAADAVQVAITARSLRPGELVVFTVSAATPVDSIQLRVFDREVPAYRLDTRTWQAIAGIDLDRKAGSYPVSCDALSVGQHLTTTTTLLVKPRKFPTRTLRVDDSFVNPSAPVLERITREAAELEHLWEQPAPSRLWHDTFVRPVPGPANGRFGSRSVFNGQPRQPHGGADFLSPSGTPILAPTAGLVVLARDLYFTGNTVVIDHGLGMFSLFAHLSVTDVRVGERVTTGQTLGQVGATGRVTGPHLHWAIRINGARVDPMAVLAIIGSGLHNPVPLDPGPTR